VHELSDGERQKVMIARALAQDTPFIILDEPTAFLDLPARYEIFRILNDLTLRNHKTILFSTHDLSLAIDVADKIWLLAENDVYQGAPEDLLISKVFRKLFLNSPAEFDSKTSTFRFRRELNKQIGLQGESRYRSLTKRAMERIGFQSADEITDITVNLAEKEGKPVWYLQQNQNIFTFYSIYDLIVHLKLTTN
jgi:iron complex transport system ATP-binding protein